MWLYWIYQDPLLRIASNDKPGYLACDEDAARVECGLQNVSINTRHNQYYFNQPEIVDLATALYDFMKLSNN